MTQPAVVVIGGGITGMVAAHTLVRRARGGVQVVLLESSDRLGGKILTATVHGVPVDQGPDSFMREKTTIELCDELGLKDEIVEPAVFAGLLWTRQGLKPATERKISALLLGRRDDELREGGGRRIELVSLKAGVGELVDALAGRLTEADVRTGTRVTAVRARGEGFDVDAGGETIAAAGVVLAVPSYVATEIIAPVSDAAAAELAGIEYRSVALISLVYPAGAVELPADASGFLAPPDEGTTMSGCTFYSRKWPTAAPDDGAVILRASVGRPGHNPALDLDDADLTAKVQEELRQGLSITGDPIEAVVTRWDRSLRMYETGHAERIARVEKALDAAPGLILAGAAYRGTGISDCVRSGIFAAEKVLSVIAATLPGGPPAPAPASDAVEPPATATAEEPETEETPPVIAHKRQEEASEDQVPPPLAEHDLVFAWYPVFRSHARNHALGVDRALAIKEVHDVLDRWSDRLKTRGIYSMVGISAAADLMMWLVAHSPDDLQSFLVEFKATRIGRMLEPVDIFLGLVRPAEFAPDHLPAFVQGKPPKPYICVYPFVRTPEWYLLDPAERGRLLREHGEAGREFSDVNANTTSAFGLGDYEWILAFEADGLDRIVELIRRLRSTEARRYTKVEVPFYTGIRKELGHALLDLL